MLTLNGISKFRSFINYEFHSLMTESHVWLTYLHSSAPNTNQNIITMRKATNFIVFDKSFQAASLGDASLLSIVARIRMLLYVLEELLRQHNRILTWVTANPPGFRPQNTPTRWV